jgi:hypothetical protein
MKVTGKSTWFLCLLLGLALMLPGFAWSAGPAGQPGGKVKASEQASPRQRVTGRISFMEPDGTVVIKGASGPAAIIYVQEGTTITRNGNPAKFGDLKVGDEVQALADPGRKALEIKAKGP